MTALSVTKQSTERISVDVPPEPPLLSVVIDHDGTAWQSHPHAQVAGKTMWMSAGSRSFINITADPELGSTRWALLVERGPLLLVHRGDQPVIWDA